MYAGHIFETRRNCAIPRVRIVHMKFIRIVYTVYLYRFPRSLSCISSTVAVYDFAVVCVCVCVCVRARVHYIRIHTHTHINIYNIYFCGGKLPQFIIDCCRCLFFSRRARAFIFFTIPVYTYIPYPTEWWRQRRRRRVLL